MSSSIDRRKFTVGALAATASGVWLNRAQAVGVCQAGVCQQIHTCSGSCLLKFAGYQNDTSAVQNVGNDLLRYYKGKQRPENTGDLHHFSQSEEGLDFLFSRLNHYSGKNSLYRSRALDSKETYIFDIHTHYIHRDVPHSSRRGFLNMEMNGGQYWWLCPRRFNIDWESGSANLYKKHWNSPTKGPLRFRNYVRDLFTESDTDCAFIVGAPQGQHSFGGGDNFLDAGDLDKTSEIIGKAAENKQRHFSAGLIGLGPNIDIWGAPSLINGADKKGSRRAWKIYPNKDGLWKNGYNGKWTNGEWFKSDVANRIYGKLRELCDKPVIFLHWGLFRGDSSPKVFHEVCKANKDITFVIFHSAFPDHHEKVGEMIAEIDNLYAGVGLVWDHLSMTITSHMNPGLKFLGEMLQYAGAEKKIVWGTDSCWYGSPQWQIEAFLRINMEPIGISRDKEKTIKRLILGENSARIFGLEPVKANDQLTKLREAQEKLKSQTARDQKFDQFAHKNFGPESQWP